MSSKTSYEWDPAHNKNVFLLWEQGEHVGLHAREAQALTELQVARREQQDDVCESILKKIHLMKPSRNSI